MNEPSNCCIGCRALRRRHCVNFSRRRGTAWATINLFKRFPKYFILSSKFSDDFLEKCNEITKHSNMASAARRSSKIGGGAHKFAAAVGAARPAQGSN